jgi:penicillin-binding protein 1B
MNLQWPNIRVWIIAVLIAGVTVAVWYGIRVEQQVQLRFQASQSSFPSRIYARAPVLYRGMDIIETALAQYLDRLGYRVASRPEVRMGEYVTGTDEWIIGVRPFMHANGREEGRKVIVKLDGNGRIAKLSNQTGQELRTVRIEPAEIGAFIPADGKDRIRVNMEDVPEHLVNAILVNEDRRFFNHSGIDLRRIAGALYANLRSGKVVQGASTVTQQLVKSIYLSRDRTLERKVLEMFIALMLERRHSKQEILEAYLNELYLGQDGAVAIHGVALAARYYFGKDIRDLDLAESALLAGLIRSPSKHAPFRYPDAALERRNFILDQMFQRGRISRAEYTSASESPLGLRPPFVRVESTSYFIDYLRKRLAGRYGNNVLEREGLSIYTTLDLRMQELAQKTVRKRLENIEEENNRLKHDESPLQAAVVVMEPRTGQVLTLVGGRDYIHSPFNRALAQRQPGSIFKPVVMLSAVKRKGERDPAFTLASVVKDEPFHINVVSGPKNTSSSMLWEPMNHDLGFREAVTAREALEWSLNVPMARLGAATGLTEIISTARRMGITSPLEPVPSLPLGSFETNLLEMARAYAVLASGGLRAPLRDVLSVVGDDGVRHKTSESTPFRIFHSSETYLVTSVLQGSVDRGTSTYLRELGYYGAVAGKTGSTNRFRDAWFVGYTPEIVIGAWVGFDAARGIGLPGAEAALPIVADIMIGILGPNGAARFSPPPGIERVRVAVRKPGSCHYVNELFLAGTAPTGTCDEGELIPEGQAVSDPAGDTSLQSDRDTTQSVPAPNRLSP